MLLLTILIAYIIQYINPVLYGVVIYIYLNISYLLKHTTKRPRYYIHYFINQVLFDVRHNW